LAPSRFTRADGDLHDKQDVDPLQTDRIDVQEVAGQHAHGRRSEELGPGRSGPPRRGIDAAVWTSNTNRSAGSRFNAGDLTAKDRDLMPQHENLHLVRVITSLNEHQELLPGLDNLVPQREDHGR
jgi:hypothetical protein